MSSTTLVAAFGVLRVWCTSMSRVSSRKWPLAVRWLPLRSMALISEPGMSMWATESPNS
jgi:hypothetical protein